MYHKRDGTTEPLFSLDQIVRHVREQGNVHFPCSVDHEQDWQPYPVDPYSTICDDHIFAYLHILCDHIFVVKYSNMGYKGKTRGIHIKSNNNSWLCLCVPPRLPSRPGWTQTVEVRRR